MSSSTTKKTTKTLTVTKREVFYDDSFFKDQWSDFDNAMKNVLKDYEDDSTKQIDLANRNQCTDVYRKIRDTNIEKDLYKSQALQITEHEGNFQCVMDVKDFNPNDLQVKVVENRVVVDGKFEKKSEDGMSMSSKSFHKEFTLPSSADIDSITTALSKDGVLTVKAPKKGMGTEALESSSPLSAKTQSSTQSTETWSSTSNGDNTTSSTKTTSTKKTVSSTSTFSSSSG